MNTSCEIALRWMPQKLTNKKFTFQYWPGAVKQEVITWDSVDPDLSSYGVTRI